MYIYRYTYFYSLDICLLRNQMMQHFCGLYDFLSSKNKKKCKITLKSAEGRAFVQALMYRYRHVHRQKQTNKQINTHNWLRKKAIITCSPL